MHAHPPARTLAGGGLFVVGCVPKSPSERAGLRYGDVLLECNGSPVEGPDSFEKARGLRADRLDLVVLRHGEVVELQISIEPNPTSDPPVGADPERPELDLFGDPHPPLAHGPALETSVPRVEGELL